jgi:hypothetical protein
MLINKQFKALALAALVGISAGLPATATPTSPFSLTGFTVNPAFIISIYNVAKQNNNQVTQLPPDLIKYDSVVQILVNNTGSSAASPYFKLVVTDVSCGSILVNSGILTTINPVGPGVTPIGAASLMVYNNSFNSTTVNQCFQNQIQNNFQDPSQLQQAINQLINTTFTVCLELCDSSGNLIAASPGKQVQQCAPLQFFNQQSSNVTTIPILIYPHNNGINTFLPYFVWAPASKMGVDPSSIRYRIEIMEGDPGNPVYERIQFPEIRPGQTFYQWSAGHRNLKAGTKYYWRAIGLDSTNNPIGGNGDSGYNITKWFEIEDGVQVAVTLGDVDDWVRAASAGEPGIKEMLDKMTVSGVINPASLGDQLYQQLKSGKATVVGVDVSTK